MIEQVLLARARSGDAKAFRMIFDRYAGSVRRFLRDLMGDEAAADEATQETFVRAHGRLGTIEKETRLGAWLFGIARNIHLETLRARRRYRPTGDDELADQPDHAPSPETVLLCGEADALLERALGHLAPERRAALLLRIDHELGYEDIAEVMGWPLGKVKNEIHRGRLDLRARLTKYVGER